LRTFFQSGSQAPLLPAHFLCANSSAPFLPQFSQQPVPFGVFQEKRSRPACRFGSLFQGSFIAFFSASGSQRLEKKQLCLYNLQ